MRGVEVTLAIVQEFTPKADCYVDSVFFIL